MKLHDLHPAAGSRRDRTRVGRGIAAGKGKTAGRGTKGQKARAGASIPAWFEGGQTPIHIRVPKLRGFKNRFKILYSVVNVGEISAYAAAGRFGVELESGTRATGAGGAGGAGDNGGAPVTVNSEVLASSGLIGSTERPVKVLGQGDVTEKLFVAADAFSASARRKIEEAGGFVQLLAPAAEAKPEPQPETQSAAEASAESADAKPEPEQAVESAPDTESAAASSDFEEAPSPVARSPRKRSTKKDGQD